MIQERLFTRNPYATDGRFIIGADLDGFFLHSVGCAGSSALSFIVRWDNEAFTGAGISGFIDPTAAYANAQVVDANLVAGNIKKDTTILGVTGTYEGSGGGGGSSTVNCKIFNFSSAAAVANQEVTVVSGDADVAAHYADQNAMVVVRKVTGNTDRGSAIILGTNHTFGVSTSMYMNYNGSTNAAAVSSVPLTAESGSGVSVRCNANGDIIVHCGSTANNFGGASYIIVFTW